MKIVAVDNFNRENKSDWLVAEHIPSETLAKIMCEALNGPPGQTHPWWYEVKPDNYELYVFEP